MGQNNRQRRAAKQRQRMQPHPARGPRGGCRPTDPDDLEAETAVALLNGVLRALMGGRPPGFDWQAFLSADPRHQQAAVDRQFSLAVDGAIATGWTPLDLYEVARQKVKGSGIAHLLDIVAAATARHPERLVHPQWRAQLDQLGAVAPDTGGRSPSFAWGERSGLDWSSALDQLLAVLVVVCGLPTIQRVLPPPGDQVGADSGTDGIDTKILRRVRGLLAKAESTEHPEEADALTAKAQELMSRYSIERAVAESAQPVASRPGARRMWLESPYADAKGMLVNAVADANNCRAVQSVTWGFVTIVGHGADLDVVELLVTSLLVQATRAMALTGPQVSRYGTSSTRSFRRSFLIAYASRIGERLRESVQATETTYTSDHVGVLVPVLAARREAVADTMTNLFPDMIERRVSVSNGAGWGAGRAAADLAQLNVRTPVSPRGGS